MWFEGMIDAKLWEVSRRTTKEVDRAQDGEGQETNKSIVNSSIGTSDTMEQKLSLSYNLFFQFAL